MKSFKSEYITRAWVAWIETVLVCSLRCRVKLGSLLGTRSDLGLCLSIEHFSEVALGVLIRLVTEIAIVLQFRVVNELWYLRFLFYIFFLFVAGKHLHMSFFSFFKCQVRSAFVWVCLVFWGEVSHQAMMVWSLTHHIYGSLVIRLGSDWLRLWCNHKLKRE